MRTTSTCCYNHHYYTTIPQELKVEMETKKGGIQAFGSFGNQLLGQGHYAAATIVEKLESLTQDVGQLDK